MPTSRLSWTLCAALAFAACDGPDRTLPGDAEPALDPDVAWERRMLFLAGPDSAPTVAVMDFAAEPEDGRLRRSARIWLAHAQAWQRVHEDDWTADAIRDPARLVPNGPLRLLLDDAGAVTIVLRRADGPMIRLEPGAALAEFRPGARTEVHLQRARLQLGSESSTGALLDVRHQRSAAAGGEPGADPPAASTSPRTAREAFVTDGADLYLVLAGEASPEAWLHVDGEERVVPGARLDRLVDTDAADAWRVVSGDVIQGELHAFTHAPGDADTADPGLTTVRGWLDVRGERQPVFGVVRTD